MNLGWVRALKGAVFGAAVLVMVSTGCGGSGGCSQLGPLAKPYPKDQLVEGGVQMRITPNGFNKLKQVLRDLINQQFAGGICIPRQQTSIIGIDIEACFNASCAGGVRGCKVTPSINSLNLSVPNPGTLAIDINFNIGSRAAPVLFPVGADIPIVGFSSCTLDMSLVNARVGLDIGFSIDNGANTAANPGTGELRLTTQNIRDLNLTGLQIGGCGILGDALNAFVGLITNVLNSQIGNFLTNLLRPQIDQLIQGFLPNPLGVEGTMDIGAALSGFAPGAQGKMEVRAVPGGYVGLRNGGLSLGINTFLNSDADPMTRTAALDSEPAECIPARPAPDLMAVPWSLTRTLRQTFALAEATEFSGTADPATDFAIGVSETVLDLAGHHIFASGGMCLAVGSSTVEQLNAGTLGILIPSLLELADKNGKAPLLLALRPMFPLDFKVGTGSMTDPHLTVNIKEMEVDFYAWINERYARTMTLVLTMNVGLNLNFVMDMMGKPALEPMLVGLDARQVTVKVINSEILAEEPAMLERVLPDLLGVVLPVVGGSIKPFALPEISGFTLGDLRLSKVTTAQDDFLAIYTSLTRAGTTPSPLLPGGFGRFQLPQDLTPDMVASMIDTTATAKVVVPDGVAGIRRAFLDKDKASRTQVVLELGGTASVPGPLEWQVRVDGGFWKPYVQENVTVLDDTAFLLEGHHKVEVRARVQGTWQVYDQSPTVLDVYVDARPPALPEAVKLRKDSIVFAAEDVAARDGELRYQVKAVDGRWMDVGTTGTLTVGDAAKMVGDQPKVLTLRVTDPAGHMVEGEVEVPPGVAFHGRAPAGAGGCGCDAGGRTQGGRWSLLVLGLMVAGLMYRSRRQGFGARALARVRRMGPFVVLLGVVLASMATPGCNCSGSETKGKACKVSGDCLTLSCGPEQIPLCLDDACTCVDDVFIGEIGKYSEVKISGEGTAYVAAYNTFHGDAMFGKKSGGGRVTEWEFVDGVPMVDPALLIPESKVRGGNTEKGDDVGRYIDLALTPTNEPRMSYYDATNGSLRFASRDSSGVWQTHMVDDGATTLEQGGEDVGRWTSIILTADGRPGIVYAALVEEGGAKHTQVRFAQAKIPNPKARTDWDLVLIDELPVTPLGPNQKPPMDFEDSVGSHMDVTLGPDGPVVAYYDRHDGDLRVASWDATAQRFKAPVVVDDMLVAGTPPRAIPDPGDIGSYPSVAVDAMGTIHLSFTDLNKDNLMYTNLKDKKLEIIDDGLRIDGKTSDGIDKPVFHLVGDDSGIILQNGQIFVVYMDATTHELNYAGRKAENLWRRKTIAGAEMPFKGAYGWSASVDGKGAGATLSSYVINNLTQERFVEVFQLTLTIE